MKITSFVPRYSLEWKPDQPDGSGRARIEEEEGLVDFFTFRGNAEYRPFTQMQNWIYPRRYQVTLPRHYHPRWWRRLTRRFAWEASKLADEAAGGGA